MVCSLHLHEQVAAVVGARLCITTEFTEYFEMPPTVYSLG